MTALLVTIYACIVWFTGYLTDTIGGVCTTTVGSIVIPVSFHQDLMTIPNGIYIERFSTATTVFSLICKPTHQGTHIPLQEAYHYECIASIHYMFQHD